jgi:hypothetical protein
VYQTSHVKPRLLPAWLVVAFFALGCGHPATRGECQEIAEHVAKLELKKNQPATDPEGIKEELESTRKWVNETTLKDCVGKRITDRAMRCVRSATSSEQIVEDCFR